MIINKTLTEFDQYYQNLWQERWPRLKEACLQEKHYVNIGQKYNIKDYYLDRASLAIAQQLAVQPGEDVLDLCAAPGGKALILINMLDQDTKNRNGSFWANDKERYYKISKLLKDCYPEKNIKVTGLDARTLYKKHQNSLDAILLDAPCSSERHWLTDHKLLPHWRPSRPKRLAIDQYAMLASALFMLRPGGRCLYVTCALNKLENQGVIYKSIKRWDKKIIIDDFVPSFAEKIYDDSEKENTPGFYCLPDKDFGGPLYGCLLYKVT